MLIKKLRGLGKDKINGPGGKVEPGETFLQAAIRETREEIGLTPHHPVHCASLEFTFLDGYSLYVNVYVSNAYSGIPRPSPEAIPIWYDVQDIPYDLMWQDDKLWLPKVLNGEFIQGAFVFDNDTMVSYQVSSTPNPEATFRASTNRTSDNLLR